MPKPVPHDDEVLVRIRATTVSAADCELRRFDFAPWIWLPMRLAFGIRRPRHPVLGQELAGDIEAVGRDVVSLRKGDRVFAATGIALGAHAEYICLRESPQTGANVRSGQRVLVNGAGGSFGSFAVQLAKVLGAHVTAVDSAPKLETLRAIGADRVIDCAQENFTGSPATYDVILDVVRGTPSSTEASRSSRWSRRIRTPRAARSWQRRRRRRLDDAALRGLRAGTTAPEVTAPPPPEPITVVPLAVLPPTGVPAISPPDYLRGGMTLIPLRGQAARADHRRGLARTVATGRQRCPRSLTHDPIHATRRSLQIAAAVRSSSRPDPRTAR